MKWRKLHRRLHLWLGLSVGILFTLIAVSGSVLVFYDELDKFLNLAPRAIGQQDRRDFDQALITLRDTYPDKKESWRLEVSDDTTVIAARYYNPVETRGEDFAPMMVWLSANGEQVLRQDFWGHYAMTWLYNLHFRLLLGKTGGVIVGYLGLACLYLLISGLVAWWPKKGQWMNKLRFKARSSKVGLLYDWHKTIGLAATLPLMLLTLSGVMLALPSESRFLLEPVFGPSQTANFSPPPARPGTQLTPTEAQTIALQALPGANTAWIETPAINGERNYYRVRLQVDDDPSRRFPHSYVYIDAITGKVEEVFDYQSQGATNTIMNWLHPLHDGTLFALPGRVLWTISGIAALALFGLGVWRWRVRTTR